MLDSKIDMRASLAASPRFTPRFLFFSWRRLYCARLEYLRTGDFMEVRFIYCLSTFL